MFNFLVSLTLASLLLPTGFNFLTAKAVDYSFSAAPAALNAPQRIPNENFGLKTTAKSILVLDNASGAVLYHKNPQAVLPIASITKLMTALVFLDSNPDWNKTVVIAKEDQRAGGVARLFPGEEVTVEDLFNLTLVASANEGAIALARISGIENFPAAMNKKAARLGLANSYFFDPSGLAPLNVSTPADLAKLAAAAFSRPEITKALKTNVYQFKVLNNGRQGSVANNDHLLDSFLNWGGYQIIGAKTGYLEEAGYCLLLEIKTKNNQSLTAVILGADSILDRWQEAKGLVDWVFRNYQWPEAGISGL